MNGDSLLFLNECRGFEWDENNRSKNWIKHQVSAEEAEEVFFNLPLVVGSDELHSATEERFYALGKTNRGRLLFIAFTIRDVRVRVISARDMHRKERKVFVSHESQEADSDVQE